MRKLDLRGQERTGPDGLREEVINEVPGLGTVVVRELTYDELAGLQRGVVSGEGDTRSVDSHELIPCMVAMSVRDEQGGLRFDGDDGRKRAGRLPHRVLVGLYTVCERLNDMGSEAIEEAKKH